MFDRDTRKSRGFGFVTFEDPAVCKRLLEVGETDNSSSLDPKIEHPSSVTIHRSSGRLEMRGKIIEVKEAQPKEQPAFNQRPKQLEDVDYGYSPVPALVHATDSNFHHEPEHDLHGFDQYDFNAKHPATPHDPETGKAQ